MAEPQIIVYGTYWCPDCKRAKKFFGEQRVMYQSIDIERDDAAREYVERINHGKRIVRRLCFPMVRFWWNPPTRNSPRNSAWKPKRKMNFTI